MRGTSPRSTHRGFTLIELMCAMAIAAVLAGIAYPSFLPVLHKARRTEALAALLNLQLTQERYRADRMAYGSLSDIGMAATTPSGHYTLSVTSISATGFDALATANGTQRGDTACRYLKLSVDGLNVVYASGATADAGNDAAANRRCWGL